MFKFSLVASALLFSTSAFALEVEKVPAMFSQSKNEMLVKFHNNKEVAVTVKFEIDDFIMLSNAHVSKVDSFDYSLKPYLEMSDKALLLKAGESKEVKLSVNTASMKDSGDYHSHLSYTEVVVGAPQQISVEMSIPLVYHGAEGSDLATIERASIEEDELVIATVKGDAKSHVSTWVEAVLMRDGESWPYVTPFYNKIYREVGEIERRIKALVAAKEGDRVVVSMWQTPKKEMLLDRLSLTLK